MKNPESNSVPANVLFRADMVGVAWRCLTVLMLLLGLLAAILMIQTQFFSAAGLSSGQITVLAISFAIAMAGGLFFSEYPRGDELALARMGLATFCRTGVPLVVILLIERYSNVELLEHGILIVVLLYGVGLFSSIILSLLPLRENSNVIHVEA